ncbi:hypothetical protein A0H81_02864 [Grifola frondosa]|uniref:Uncharacterized protein n=1 Tax=Grifola frondosa TaxID=5627 RepID=A0A1C7MKD8_GRIFR|nr:hypothetical protein A0H81_02864 [Grifola frondosa]
MSYLPLILDQLGFPVSSDFFDEPMEPDFEEDTKKKKSSSSSAPISGPLSASSKHKTSTRVITVVDDELHTREDASTPVPAATPQAASPNPWPPSTLNNDTNLSTAEVPPDSISLLSRSSGMAITIQET